MLKTNLLKQKLESNQKSLGTWNLISSVSVVDIIASAGIDFIIIDAEHGPVSYETAQQMVMACESNNVSPIMRVGSIDENLIQRALDIGIHGLQVPNITNACDAEKLVKFAKYPPIGIRGFSPFTKAGKYDFRNGPTMTKKANENTLLIANVESAEGIDNIESISKVENLDVIFIGIFDLSKSLGIPGDVENPKIIKTLKEVIKIIRSNNKFVGTIAPNKNMLEQFKKLDIAYLTYSVDTGIIKESYLDIVNQFKQL